MAITSILLLPVTIPIRLTKSIILAPSNIFFRLVSAPASRVSALGIGSYNLAQDVFRHLPIILSYTGFACLVGALAGVILVLTLQMFFSIFPGFQETQPNINVLAMYDEFGGQRSLAAYREERRRKKEAADIFDSSASTDDGQTHIKTEEDIPPFLGSGKGKAREPPTQAFMGAAPKLEDMRSLSTGRRGVLNQTIVEDEDEDNS